MVSPAGPQPVDVSLSGDIEFRIDIRFRKREVKSRLSANRPVLASTGRAVPRHSRVSAAGATPFTACRE